MTADADASTRAARRGRAPFELLRFSATPVPGALVVVEIEGRVATASGRFARRPVLVVEPAEDRSRLELAPSRSTLDGDRWQAAYAIPAEAYDAARFALGLRGTLLDLPTPDEPTAADRQTLLAREANALRRQLEAAESAATAARADATAAAGELGAAVSAARDEALAESAERLDDLEREVVEAHRLSASDAAELRTAHETALADATARHDAALAAKDRALEEATARHEAALAEAAAGHDVTLAEALAAKDRALEDAATRGDVALADAVARHEAEVAELRAVHEEALAAKERALEEESEAHDAEVAQLRATPGEGAQEQDQRRRVADAQARALAAEEGIGVLRAELAEERERSQTRIAELEQELVAATNRLEALRRAAEADAPEAADAARIADLEQQLAAATARADALRRAVQADAVGDEDGADEDATQALWSVPDRGDDATRPLRREGAGDGDRDQDETRVLRPGREEEDLDRTQVLSAVPEGEVEETRPFTAKEERDARGERVLPLERGALPRRDRGRGMGAWVAVAALVVFVLVLMVLLGFVG